VAWLRAVQVAALPAFRGEVCNFAQTLWAERTENGASPTPNCHKPELPLNDNRVERLGRCALLPALRTDRNGHCFRRRFGRTSKIASQRRQPVERWEHEAVLETVQDRLDRNPDKMRVRRQTVEHPFGTIKAWMGATHFQMRRLPKVASEMALHVLAYNMKRVMQILGVCGLMAAMRA
jgi:hypothetical protein